jgi:hypothetical protein
MYRFRIPEIFLGCFLTVAIFATGMIFARQEQSASPTQSSKNEESSESNKVRNPDTELTDSIWLPKDAAGFFTFGLVVVGIAQALLFFFQLRYMRIGMRDATVTANAAKTSADSLAASERARFYIVIEHHNLTEVIKNVERRGPKTGERFSIRYRFQNYGKTPGIVKVVIINSRIAKEPVEPPANFTSLRDFPEYMIGAGHSTKTQEYDPVPFLDLEQVQSVARNSARLWFFGRLYYDDVFGNHQVHRFYFRSVSPLGSDICVLQPYDYQDFNQST